MASTVSTDPAKESDNQDNKSNQLSKAVDESKTDLPTPPSHVEETIERASVTILERHYEQQNDLSPHLIQKQSYIPLASACIAARSPCQDFARAKRGVVNHARPFDEFRVDQPSTDASSGPSIKSDDTSSSSTTRYA